MRFTRTNTFGNLAAALLLFGYLLNVVSFQSFHLAIHQHEHAVLHSEEAEADDCHRAIYHGDVSPDCQHENHITGTIKDCKLCEVTVSRFHYAAKKVDAIKHTSDVWFFQPASTKVFGYDFSLVHAPRGPPAFS